MNATDIFKNIIKAEGGFVDNPSDKGGPTKYGITLDTLSAWRQKACSRADVFNLDENEALAIYTERYFNAPGFALVNQVSGSIAYELTDTGVNMGVSVSGAFLQRLLNVLNNSGKDYPDISVDGHVGPGTIATLRQFLAKRGFDAGQAVILKGLNCLQGARYVELCEKREANETFVYGWLSNRV